MEERNIQKAAACLKELAEETLNRPVEVELHENMFLLHYQENASAVEIKIHNADRLAECMNAGTAEEWEQKKKKITELLDAVSSTGIKAERITKGKYEEIRDSLIMRPLRYKTVRTKLQEIPHLVLGDIALVLYAVMARHGGDYYTAKIQRDMLREWDISEENAIRNALRNTQALYPPRLYTVEDLLNWETDMEASGDIQKIRKGARGYILTNSLEINGAVSLFYPGVAGTIAQALEDDLYIAFTSIHEAQVHGARVILPDLIRNSLYDTNKHCNNMEEILSYSVYCYNREKEKFGRMVNGEFREEDCWMVTPSGKVRFDLANGR